MVLGSLRGALCFALLLLSIQTLQAVVGSTGSRDSVTMVASAGGEGRFALTTRHAVSKGRLLHKVRSILGKHTDDGATVAYRRAPKDELDRRGMSQASLALGVLSVGLLVTGFLTGGLTLLPSIVCGILAIVFGAISLRRHRQGYLVNRGMALAGLITGIASVAFLVLVVALVIIAFSNF